MPASPSSSVQRAREQLAERLRDLRLDAGLSGQALSAAAGWHPAKTSRIEQAKQAPSEGDIRPGCQVCGAEREVPDLIAASRAADSMYIEWRRLNRGGMRRIQDSRRPLYERTRLFKTVLRYRIGGADVIAGQLGCLLEAAALPSVSLGVITLYVRAFEPLATLAVYGDDAMGLIASALAALD